MIEVERGDHVVVRNLDGEASEAVVVGIADEPAAEYMIPTRNGERSLQEYRRGDNLSADETVVEVRYVKGVDIDGAPVSYSQTVYGVPLSAVEGGESDAAE